MALAPLATVADLEARGVTVAAEEAVFLAATLDSASTVVREAAGSPISEATSTVELEGETGSRLRLPGLPVRSVSEVLLDGVPVTGWRLRSGALWREAGWSHGCGPSAVSVTYVHGLPEVPADIVDLVCRMAGQALLSFRENEDALSALADKPLAQERIGDWSATYAFAPEFSVMEIPEKMRRRLAARFGGTIAAVRAT
ncbi:head-tail adaptor [Streptomyces phage phiSASD1]|uniref:Gp29 n=1 Tax=Streptomyces phage phiSASD1 TaxID=747763 RepID=D7NW55_9CAUD|nr:head-tail adaptor [Streptomyces phage phiSASD1]ADE43453.1 gp29 [Streptomyces phage phiSASD1]